MSKVANNTYRTIENGKEIIRLHSTNIVVIDHANKTITLNTGGWKSKTTKDRINNWVGLYGYDIRQIKGNWYVNGGGLKENTEFIDGMELQIPG